MYEIIIRTGNTETHFVFDDIEAAIDTSWMLLERLDQSDRTRTEIVLRKED